MIIIPESTIDDLVEYYEAFPETLITKTADYMDEFPTLLAYLDQESNEVLLDEERDLHWYIVVVCLSASLEEGVEIRPFTVEGLSAAEETNWELLQEAGPGSWRDRLDPFFASLDQEDLLAFVEDLLQEDEESPLTTIGREVIFISVKSILDCIFAES